MITYADLSLTQRALVDHPLDGRGLFVDGAAGSGKTRAAVARLTRLIESGVPAGSIAVLTPQRTLALPYIEALRRADVPPGGSARVTTFSGIAREYVSLYWQAVVQRAGFAPGALAPTFLTLETAQYIMAQIVNPLIDGEGFFETVTLPRGRLYSQLLDNLNRAAIGGFPIAEVGDRLKRSWAGDQAQARMFDEMQHVIERFRAHCLAHHLLDYSLLIETFMAHTLPVCRDRLFSSARHLIFDNVEEENAAAHRLYEVWIEQAHSALVLLDSDGGVRRFLGAEPEGGYALHESCDGQITLEGSFVMGQPVAALADALTHTLHMGGAPDRLPADPRAAFTLHLARFTPDMLNWAAACVAALITDGVPPRQIALLAPYMSDALRFSLLERLAARGIPARSHRPSRALRDEPVVRALLTLARLAHPTWGEHPDQLDVTHALMAALSTRESGALDLPRAHLLAAAAYPSDLPARLLPFDSFPPDVQDRLTYVVGEKYDRLRLWLEAYISSIAIREPVPAAEAAKRKRRRKKTDPTPEAPPPPHDPPIDHFFSRLFAEVLSGRGYGLHRDLIAADAGVALIESARGFRRTLERTTAPSGTAIGQAYLNMIDAGVIANQYAALWLRPDSDAVLVAPAFTFLMEDRAVDHQFWLDVNGRGWSERVFQPLTHPVILSPHWTGEKWGDREEQEYQQEQLFRLAIGLLRRCRIAVHWGMSELGETGTTEQGALLDAINRLIRRLAPPEEAHS